MRERVCKNCGGKSYKVVGQNMVKCEFCGTLYVDEHASKEEEVLVIGANEIARALRFEDAVDEFDKVLSLFPMSFEGYFGKALAKNKIILYSNKKWSTRKPRFFETIPNILQDEDFKKAVELAPEETIKTYLEQGKRIERYKKQYDEHKVDSDIVFCAAGYDKNSPNPIVEGINQKLREKYSVYFLPDKNEREAWTFRALETCKVFLLYVDNLDNITDYKNLFDRYFYFTNQKKKTKSGFIIVLDEAKVQKINLPKELMSYKNVISSTTSLDDLAALVDSEVEKSKKEVAKIDTITLKNEQPRKKEYVGVESIDPADLGHYKVENVSLSDENKVQWIYLLLKNGDFVSARQLVSQELEKDPNNARVLFADLLASKGIRTEEDFFANIANFREREKIDVILKYASKDFAEYFVDSVENLIIKLDSLEYYQTYLLYLAGFNTPNREHFVECAENLAVETLDEKLIDLVQKCFNPQDVDRFINFYYMLAQKSDDQKYYDKILELDQGHEQSNMTKFLEHFNTDENKLTYRNREEIENIFKYLNETSRANFVMQVVNLVLPLAFKNLAEAEKQIDFYLSYITDDGKLCFCLNQVATSFQEMGFFKQAEKYISIALSKDKNNAQYYWTLIKAKAHCMTDSEVVTSPVKFSEIPEWETLISVATEQQREKFAEVLSKNSLYKGEKAKFVPDTLDLLQLKEKLGDFLSRNGKILLEVDAELGVEAKSKADYYRVQLKPLQDCLQKLDSCENFEQFSNLSSQIYKRLDLLDLTFETSIKLTEFSNRNEGLKNIYAEKEKQEIKHQKQLKRIRNDKFLKRYLFVFVELFPIAFLTLLLIFAIFVPKQVYKSFNQEFMIISLICTSVIVVGNLIFFFIKRKKLDRHWKLANISIFVLGIINVILFAVGFYFAPIKISVANTGELKTYLANAKYGHLELSEDINMGGKNWKGVKFYGTLDGKNHRIYNIKLTDGGFFSQNSGKVKNLQMTIDQTLNNQGLFGAFAKVNSGRLENCVVSGTLTATTNIDSVVGGLVGRNVAGEVISCKSNLTISITATNCQMTFGGYIGEVKGGKSQISKNSTSGAISITSDGAELKVGGLIGSLMETSSSISENAIVVNISAVGTAKGADIGGLVGDGHANSSNNYTTGQIVATGLSSNEVANLGGLYGRYLNAYGQGKGAVSYSYSLVTITADHGSNVGGLFGYCSGSVRNCFSNIDIIGQSGLYNSLLGTCTKTNVYLKEFNFSSKVWVVPADKSETMPKLKWEN